MKQKKPKRAVQKLQTCRIQQHLQPIEEFNKYM